MTEEEMGCIEVNGKLFWECGCITYQNGTEFVLVACNNKGVCPVVAAVHKKSNERGIPIRHRKG